MGMKETILAALEEATVIYVGESPIITSFPVELENGQLVFSWIENDLGNINTYTITITEKMLENAEINSDGFNMQDEDDCLVVLSTYTCKANWK